MKKLLTLAVALVVAGGIWSGMAAIASPQSPEASAGLPARVRSLEGKVRTLRVQIGDLRGKVACLTALPISQYGDNVIAGYVYSNDGGNTVFLTTGLDVTAQGQAPGAWVARIDNSCVSGASARTMATSSYRAERTIDRAHALK